MKAKSKEAKVLGEISQITGSKALVPVTQLPGLGKKVFDEKGKQMGKTIDYIGQTKAPYVVIELQEKPGKKLYF